MISHKQYLIAFLFTVLFVAFMTIFFAGAFGLLGLGHDTSHRIGAGLMTSFGVYVSRCSLTLHGD